MHCFFVGIKSEKELYRKLISLKYVILIYFLDDGVCYKIARNEPKNRMKNATIQFACFSEGVKQMYNRLLCKLHIYKGSDHIHRKLVTKFIDIKYRELYESLLELLREEKRYGDDGIKYKIRHLASNAQNTLNLEDDGKDVFRLITLFLLVTSNDAIHNDSGQNISIIYSLETFFLQYFTIGNEQEQKLFISDDDLYKIMEKQSD